ncbi:OsmC family protein [Flavobacterium agrisoli]|uniref:OsmC family protein n=1 Tax=Flavobacterium agrisoli TaxID=2793066 RepID=A0A934UIM4_9FLAO|nr:OsmC family protein [Flavobacterium agrisoli]MBK0369031.1 OsmC family protein [Flavobacterium agrisoli]
METISAHIGLSNYKTTIRSTSGNTLIADEPEELGGENLGFSPSELLASALASCTAITLRMYAQRKEWNLVDVIVEANLVKEEDETTRFQLNIKLFGDLDAAQRQCLFDISKKCPIHKILLNQIKIENKLES